MQQGKPASEFVRLKRGWVRPAKAGTTNALQKLLRTKPVEARRTDSAAPMNDAIGRSRRIGRNWRPTARRDTIGPFDDTVSIGRYAESQSDLIAGHWLN